VGAAAIQLPWSTGSREEVRGADEIGAQDGFLAVAVASIGTPSFSSWCKAKARARSRDALHTRTRRRRRTARIASRCALA